MRGSGGVISEIWNVLFALRAFWRACTAFRTWSMYSASIFVLHLHQQREFCYDYTGLFCPKGRVVLYVTIMSSRWNQ